MANYFFPKGKQHLVDVGDWDTDAIKTMLADINASDTAFKAITGVTNPGNPMVVTATSHGFANGDTVVITGVVGSTAANNIWTIQNVASNTFEVVDATGASTNNGAYSSGGIAVCLGPSAAGDNIDDFSAGRVGTDQTLGSKTLTNAVLDAADPTFTLGAAQPSVEAYIIYDNQSGAESTSPCLHYTDGTQKVEVMADAASSATTIWVKPLEGAIPNSTVIIFSNGVSATLTAAPSAGARSITVSAIASAIQAGRHGTAPITNAGIPFTPPGGGGDVVIVFDNGANKIGVL